jgi:hypothetical protein
MRSSYRALFDAILQRMGTQEFKPPLLCFYSDGLPLTPRSEINAAIAQGRPILKILFVGGKEKQ